MNILSLDGGGARGIITIKIIQTIVKIANKITGKTFQITDLFDFFCGSSVGTLIISVLLIPDPTDPKKPKYTIDNVLDMMIKKSPLLFETSFLQNLRTLWGFRLPKYLDDTRVPIYNDLFGDLLFGQLLGSIVFPAGDTISNKPIYFHNYYESHKKLKVCDILLGTTAAPTYFLSKMLEFDGKKVNLIDSGCVANNTSQLAFVEAINHYKRRHLITSLYELSIGTGQVATTYDPQWWGAFKWIPMISTTLIDFNSINQEYELSLISDINQIDRFDPEIPQSLDYLDCPQYIPQYLELTEKWITDNNEKIYTIVIKILNNKGLLPVIPSNLADSSI